MATVHPSPMGLVTQDMREPASSKYRGRSPSQQLTNTRRRASPVPGELKSRSEQNEKGTEANRTGMAAATGEEDTLGYHDHRDRNRDSESARNGERDKDTDRERERERRDETSSMSGCWSTYSLRAVERDFTLSICQ